MLVVFNLGFISHVSDFVHRSLIIWSRLLPVIKLGRLLTSLLMNANNLTWPRLRFLIL